MARFEYISRNKLELKGGMRHATLGDVPEPVVYGDPGQAQGALRRTRRSAAGRRHPGHIVAAVGG